ncbi:serine protease [Bacillus shivajii]|uniref:S1C family serine protease n=1 Tax=Bacillus shivajii TaxID=1983719 RepID=UPI001CFA671B|nr:serine protease [Bacillus shivajii]UCZ53949.1 serine protease [Bacillus shivajii]
MRDSNNDHDQDQEKKEEHKQPEEELFFDGENYYTKEEFFNPEDEKENEPKKKNSKWLRMTIAFMLVAALLGNVFAVWPQLFNLASIEFLQISRELSQNEDVQLYKESVVVVRNGNSKGTGFTISEDGHIMTNHHVVDEGFDITVTFQEGEAYRADIIESDPDIDIAILKVDDESFNHPVLTFEDSWKAGMSVYFIGNPLFFNFIANRGEVLDLTPERDIPMLMIDAPIYRGNSGSPVINAEGNVVAVIYATTRTEFGGERKRVGLAVPVEYFTDKLDVLD